MNTDEFELEAEVVEDLLENEGGFENPFDPPAGFCTPPDRWGGRYYKVKYGDTLWGLARAVIDANNLEVPVSSKRTRRLRVHEYMPRIRSSNKGKKFRSGELWYLPKFDKPILYCPSP